MTLHLQKYLDHLKIKLPQLINLSLRLISFFGTAFFAKAPWANAHGNTPNFERTLKNIIFEV
jgi:hypothetical protein